MEENCFLATKPPSDRYPKLPDEMLLAGAVSLFPFYHRVSLLSSHSMGVPIAPGLGRISPSSPHFARDFNRFADLWPFPVCICSSPRVPGIPIPQRAPSFVFPPWFAKTPQSPPPAKLHFTIFRSIACPHAFLPLF